MAETRLEHGTNLVQTLISKNIPRTWPQLSMAFWDLAESCFPSAIMQLNPLKDEEVGVVILDIQARVFFASYSDPNKGFWLWRLKSYLQASFSLWVRVCDLLERFRDLESSVDLLYGR